MKNLGRVVLHIPAREGSQRVPKKNMRLMNGRPMISYAIEASLKSNVTKFIYVNTDSETIINYVTDEYPDCNIYLREKILANNTASSDQFNYDIISKLKPDTLIMINPVCPLIESVDIISALLHYKNSDCDTLISSNSTHMQTFCEGKPVNICVDEQLAPSQKNNQVTILNWAITIWDAKAFKHRMEEHGFAVLGGKRDFYEIDALKSIKVSIEEDFLFAEQVLKCK